MRALALFLLVWATPALAQMVLVMSRSGYVREARNSSADDCHHAQTGEALLILDEDQTNGYYHVRAQSGCEGYIYKSLGRRRPDSEMPAWAVGGGPTPSGDGNDPTAGDGRLTICSFNIKWLGHYTRKKHEVLAKMMAEYDIVIVQELMDPPVEVQLSGRSIDADEHSAQFFQFMEGNGFLWAISESGTGKAEPPGGGNSQEWPAVFYRDDEVRFVRDQSRFVSSPAIENPHFDRVPYAFHFAAQDGTLDFTVINSHLRQGDRAVDEARRVDEMAEIGRWCTSTASSSGERDFLIVGDLNLYSIQETASASPSGFVALNNSGIPTTMNTNQGGRPFDNVIYTPTTTGRDLVLGNDQFDVLDLSELASRHWIPPGNPPSYANDYRAFEECFSDHKPIVFELRYGIGDDD